MPTMCSKFLIIMLVVRLFFMTLCIRVPLVVHFALFAEYRCVKTEKPEKALKKLERGMESGKILENMEGFFRGQNTRKVNIK